ncbi:asparagine synthase (glutamine-hydrolyzing) [Pedobacter cryophilus]|uniref:asparagine synthase (glutamine-hydrolyzing) n=1 Tax=Pedobacter cryophilus TaxID=2571271 RepID=A0A4V5NXC4_9SPHI|nr:asparagine synthase (glutamine-hydrolyzing) [Pedobacter cryophilus]TKB98633.1 asparagine synthase (glutamine-hydrolyzing) [Pedobacter cryophilus]
MCRIAGIINKNYSKQELTFCVRAMTTIQQHGGPDDEGFYIDESSGLALGHRRLSLLDLSNLGHQPMFDMHQQYGIIFNGEIYNYQDIKTELCNIGYVFKSSTDTEVILNAFIEWGVVAFKKLKGMFAFALIDHLKKELYLVRDPQGIKPLYYTQQQDSLYFASEVKAFSQLPFKIAVNKDWPIAFLSMGHLPEPMTTLSNVWMLKKGHFLKIDLTSKKLNIENLVPFFNKEIEALKVSALEAQILVDRALDQAIQKQLVADASIGVFLSGGIDSSLLALQASKYQEDKLITVSLHFPEAQYSEKKYQDTITAKLPGKHIAKEVSKQDFDQYFEEIIAAMDQPSTDGINSWFVSKAAKDAGLKAVLSGIGADELFGGYPSFKRIKNIPLARNFRSLIVAGAKLIHKDALQRVSYLKHRENSIYEYLFLRGFFNPQQLQHFFNIDNKQQEKALHFIPEPSIVKPFTYDGKKAAWYEQHYFMQNQLLKDADYMSMQHGLEVRVPFLDQDLVQLCNSLPASLIFNKNKPAKHLLIHAFDNLLPQQIWDRPKMGFTFPFQYWLKEHPLYLQTKQSYLKNKSLTSLFKAYEEDQLHWSKIMSLIVLEKFGGKDALDFK